MIPLLPRHAVDLRVDGWFLKPPVYLHPSKALFPLDPNNLQLHCFLGLGTLSCCSLVCPRPCGLPAGKRVRLMPCLF